VKARLCEIAQKLDPLELLEEIRRMQRQLAVLADGGQTHRPERHKDDLTRFLASLATAWQGGEVRPTHRMNSKPVLTWRIRKGPFETAWPTICAWLESNPDQTGKALFDRLRKERSSTSNMNRDDTVRAVGLGASLVALLHCDICVLHVPPKSAARDCPRRYLRTLHGPVDSDTNGRGGPVEASIRNCDPAPYRTKARTSLAVTSVNFITAIGASHVSTVRNVPLMFPSRIVARDWRTIARQIRLR
jgi:hypothetical protein